MSETCPECGLEDCGVFQFGPKASLEARAEHYQAAYERALGLVQSVALRNPPCEASDWPSSCTVDYENGPPERYCDVHRARRLLGWDVNGKRPRK